MLRSTLFLALAGCLPDDALQQRLGESGALEDAAVDWSGFTLRASADGPVPTLTSGLWAPVATSLVRDPCDVDELLDDALGLEPAALLPRTYAVAGDVGRFEIQAQGDDPPALCIKDGPGFTCEALRVTPLGAGLAGAGWSSTVELAGEVVHSRRLEGTAVVSFPSLERGTPVAPDALGGGLPACELVLDLDLELQPDLDQDAVPRPGVDRTPPRT